MHTRSAPKTSADRGYGKVFEILDSDNSSQRGKRHLEDALRILENRLQHNQNLRKLPLSSMERESLSKECFSFLKEHNKGSYEKDNIAHVQRLTIAINQYRDDLREYLDVDYKDVQLLAALHDLGKSLEHEDILNYLSTIFGEKDFISLRVIPHELYSMFWIRRLCVKHGIAEDVISTLMDQIANHNFGPNLSLPLNKDLFANAEGSAKHWWLDHWNGWTKKARQNGLKVSAQYGHTVSPLATSLVLFDRVDGGELESWEKYLNQELLSGTLQLSPAAVIRTIDQSSSATHDQILAVGRQIKECFVSSQLKIDEFRPYLDALRMEAKNAMIVKKFIEANQPDNFAKLKILPESSILFRTLKGAWFRIDGFSKTRETGRKFEWRENRWHEVDQNDSPIKLLMELIYADRESP